MKKILSIFITVFLFANVNKSFAQCSDAGVCQLSFEHEESNKNYNVGVSYSFGSSGKDDDVKFHSAKLNFFYQPFRNTKLTVILPYNLQSGPLGDVSGIGDLILSFTQNIFSDRIQSASFTFGGKIATGDDNQKKLPQIYQSGLGTNDLLLGLNYSNRNVMLGVGYQVAGNRNDNSVTRLERGDDFIDLIIESYEKSLSELENVNCNDWKMVIKIGIAEIKKFREELNEIKNKEIEKIAKK